MAIQTATRAEVLKAELDAINLWDRLYVEVPAPVQSIGMLASHAPSGVCRLSQSCRPSRDGIRSGTLRGSCRLLGPRSRDAPRSRYLSDSKISCEHKLARAQHSLFENLASAGRPASLSPPSRTPESSACSGTSAADCGGAPRRGRPQLSAVSLRLSRRWTVLS